MSREETVVIDGEEILLIRSTRRKKTIAADLHQGKIRVMIPARLSQAMEDRNIREMVYRMRRKLKAETFTPQRLMQLALELNDEYFAGTAEPASVEFGMRQQRRWGCCFPQTRRILINPDVASMPEWVVKAVLVHELCHLLVPNHSKAFRQLEARYPRTAEAKAFLLGVTYGREGKAELHQHHQEELADID